MAETDVLAGPAVRVRTARTADNAQLAAIWNHEVLTGTAITDVGERASAHEIGDGRGVGSGQPLQAPHCPASRMWPVWPAVRHPHHRWDEETERDKLCGVCARLPPSPKEDEESG